MLLRDLNEGLNTVKKARQRAGEEEVRKLMTKFDRERYKQWFDGKYRIYLPLSTSVSLENKIESALEDNSDTETRYILKSYKDGVVTKVFPNGKERDEKLGKVLGKIGREDLQQLYSSSKAQGFKSEENQHKDLMVVISRNPNDILTMTAGRSWGSCMNLGSAVSKKRVFCDVESGTLIAYLTTSDDHNLNRPIGRFLLKPYVNSETNEKILIPEKRVYGSAVFGFKQTVIKWLVEKQGEATEGYYDVIDGIYADSIPAHISIDQKTNLQYFNIDDYNSLSEEDKRNIYVADQLLILSSVYDRKLAEAIDANKKKIIKAALTDPNRNLPVALNDVAQKLYGGANIRQNPYFALTTAQWPTDDFAFDLVTAFPQYDLTDRAGDLEKFTKWLKSAGLETGYKYFDLNIEGVNGEEPHATEPIYTIAAGEFSVRVSPDLASQKKLYRYLSSMDQDQLNEVQEAMLQLSDSVAFDLGKGFEKITYQGIVPIQIEISSENVLKMMNNAGVQRYRKLTIKDIEKWLEHHNMAIEPITHFQLGLSEADAYEILRYFAKTNQQQINLNWNPIEVFRKIHEASKK